MCNVEQYGSKFKHEIMLILIRWNFTTVQFHQNTNLSGLFEKDPCFLSICIHFLALLLAGNNLFIFVPFIDTQCTVYTDIHMNLHFPQISTHVHMPQFGPFLNSARFSIKFLRLSRSTCLINTKLYVMFQTHNARTYMHS